MVNAQSQDNLTVPGAARSLPAELRIHSESSLRALLISWLLLTPVLLFAGYHQIFSTLSSYDDEGYVMLSLVTYRNGAPLYDETYSQYGPLLFQANSVFHTVTNLPVNHNVVRLKTLAVWWLTATLIMVFLFRETSSWRLATIGLLLSFFHLDRLCLEPGHPQELCVLAIVLSLLIASRLIHSPSPVRLAALLGAVVGAAVMVKINIGVFLFVSASLLMLLRGPNTRLGNTLLRLGAVGAVLLPFLVAFSHVSRGSSLALPIVCAASLACVALTAHHHLPTAPRMRLSVWIAFLGGTLFVIAIVCGLTLWQGTSPEKLWYGLIGQHAGFDLFFFTPAPLPGAAVVLAVFVLDIIWRGPRRQTIGLVRLTLTGTLLFCMLQYLQELPEPLAHGQQDRGGAALLLGLGCPLIWVLLRPGIGLASERENPHLGFGRLPLCLFAVLQPMAAYPTPGTQMAVGTLLLVAGALVALNDVLNCEREWLPRAELAVPALLLLMICTTFVRAARDYQHRASLAPLNLPGADLLRVPQAQAERLHWLVNTLREESETFVFGEHAFDSLYFWTQLPPPTSLNPTFWPFLLNSEEQKRVIAALEDSPRSAVVHQPYPLKLPEGPLVKYLAENYEPAYQFGQTEIWLPRKSENE